MTTTEEIYFEKKKSTILFAASFLGMLLVQVIFSVRYFLKQCLKYIWVNITGTVIIQFQTLLELTDIFY